MRRHLPALAVALILGACTFPGVTYNYGASLDGEPPLESSVAEDAPVSGEAGDATTGRDATTDGPGQETSVIDAPPPPSDAYVFEAAADAPPCDQDQDTYIATGGNCGGTDCDDEDPRAHPNQDYLTAMPHPPTNGDWNCDHVVEKLFPSKVNCNASITNCDSTSGFTDDPGCGLPGNFVQCMTMNVIFCVEGASSMQLQACK